METRTNEIDRQIRELTKKEGSCWVGIFNQEDEQVHEHRFTADKTGEPTPTLDDYEKLEENIRYLTDDIIHGEFVFQFAQFDDDSDCLQQLQDELVKLILGKFGYPDEAISLPHP